jgi:serine/threonine protein kinase
MTTPLGRARNALPGLAGLFPQFEILGPIGRGGMGVVYKARQIKLDRPVALKVIRPEALGDSSFAERFAREARAMARLNHPNIVSVFDFGETSGLFYLVMEWVLGLDLRHSLEAGPLSIEVALLTAIQICDALQYAHDQGVVHRDIKPENILRDAQGRVKIADFGLAKLLLPDSAPFTTLTETRHVLGTPHYMAPEQLERPKEVDHRADIYSVGVVLYEMITGTLPLGRYELPSEKHDVDESLDEIVIKALHRNPAQRYQNIGRLRSDLLEYAESNFDLDEAWNSLRENRVSAASTSDSAPSSSEDERKWARVLLLVALGWLVMGVGIPISLGLATYSEQLANRLPEGWQRDLGHLSRYGLAFGFVLLLCYLILKAVRATHRGSAELKEGQAATGQTNEDPRPIPDLFVSHAASRRARKPALALIVVSALNAIFAGMITFAWIAVSMGFELKYYRPTLAIPYGITVLLICSLVAIGGLHALQLRSFRWAIAASLLALSLPTPLIILNLPLGLWALSEFTHPDVLGAFQSTAQVGRHRWHEAASAISGAPAWQDQMRKVE